MPIDTQAVLLAHKQLFRASCAASCMELVLKLHGKVPQDWHDFQNTFKEDNIGFSKLDEWRKYGLAPSTDAVPVLDAIPFIERHVRAGTFPLVSLRTGSTTDLLTFREALDNASHIFVALPSSAGFILAFHAHQMPAFAIVPDLRRTLSAIARLDSTFKVDVAYYSLQP